MKKSIMLIILTFVITLLCGCSLNDPKYINLSSKPSNHYYTDELRSHILNNEKYTLYVFDTNMYKEITVENDENITLENFLNSLSSANYCDKKNDGKELYRLKVEFENDKYLIKVYNATDITISPWDGNYAEDSISMEDIPLHYNLLDFCNHIENKPSAEQ